MTKRAAAYLRKSKDAATKADHLAMLMASVKDHGHNGEAVVYDDWAKSGDIEKLAARTEWRRLCDAIEAGVHDVVFMNSLDRGGRSIEEWLRFIRLCRASGVRVIADGTDYSLPENRDRLIFEAWAAEKELDKAKERSARTRRIRAARGDVVTGGHAAGYGRTWVRAGDAGIGGDPRRVVEVQNPNEPLQPLIDAARETRGNVLAASKLLNTRGVPTRSGKPWSPRTLGRVLDREGVIRAKYGARVRRAPSTAPLSRLVACHCRQLMTPVRDRRTGRWSELYCAAGHKAGVGAHGRYVARSRHVMDRLRAEKPVRVSRIAILKGSKVEDAEARRTALAEKRRRLGIVFADGGLDEDVYRQEVDDIKRAITDLDDQIDADWIGFGPRTPVVPWDGDEEELGVALRQRVRVVRLDEAMRPAEVVWR